MFRILQKTVSNYSDFFCYQCEQSVVCQKSSVCGKSSTTAILQDLLLENLKNISDSLDKRINEVGDGKDFREIQEFCVDTLYSTLTNVNFDAERFQEWILQAKDIIVGLGEENVAFSLPKEHTLDSLEEYGKKFLIPRREEILGEDIVSLQETITYGLKGYAAYLHEASLLTSPPQELYDFFCHAMGFLSADHWKEQNLESLVSLAMEVGEKNIGVMACLDAGNNEQFGVPQPTSVSTTPRKGKAICVSGHNYLTLKHVLEQTKDAGINVYTHGEMLPAHSYPELNQYDHLVGHYGKAWQDQQKEFKKFPGSILLTTNCLMPPKKGYKDRIFSHSLVGHSDVQHIENDDFSALIDCALKEKGFKKDGKEETAPLLTGFGHGFVSSIGDVLVDAVKDGDIEHFWLIGGCDGVKDSRNYYTEIVKNVPKNHVILTLACGKFKFNDLQEELGVIRTSKDGVEIPRLLDVGQCNDAFSAVKIAQLLGNAFGLEDLNDLPLSIVLSWYEQKAVVILLSLLHLNFQHMRIGPSLPYFLSPNVLNFLVENFKLTPIGDPKEDIIQILNEKKSK